VRMWSGRAFQVAGPACENARLPNHLSATALYTSVCQQYSSADLELEFNQAISEFKKCDATTARTTSWMMSGYDCLNKKRFNSRRKVASEFAATTSVGSVIVKNGQNVSHTF